MRKLLLIALVAAATSLIPAGVAAERLPDSLHGGDPFSAALTGHGSGTARQYRMDADTIDYNEGRKTVVEVGTTMPSQR